MKTCRADVLSELRFQQDIASAADPHVPHEALAMSCCIGPAAVDRPEYLLRHRAPPAISGDGTSAQSLGVREFAALPLCSPHGWHAHTVRACAGN
jgi:hypothetical protein